MAKIVFIEPKAPNLHIFSQFYTPRLGTFILGTMMKQRGWDVEIMVEEYRPVDYTSLGKADLVGISTITSTAPRAYAIADRVRGMGIPVVMGGPHVTFLTEEALQHADFVVRGEGEVPFEAFARAWEEGRSPEDVPGLSFTREGAAVHNPKPAPVRDISQYPFPDPDLVKQYLVKQAGKYTVPVQTSRGCPFNCTFCSVTGMFGKKYRYRSTEDIIAELKHYDDKRYFIFFYDDNFTADRKRTIALLKAMIRENFSFKWSTQTRADIARDTELVRLMKKAGCFTLFIGFESVNPESLKTMKKKQSVEDIHNAVRVLRRKRIHVHGMFVYGFETDTEATVRETLKFALRSGMSSAQFLILTPLPGSEFFTWIDGKNRIRFRDWNLYDAHHPVFEPKNFTMAALQRAQIRSHQRFYSLPRILRRVLALELVAAGIARYARHLNRIWKKRNKTFLRVIDLLRPIREARISITYEQKIQLDDDKLAA